MDSLSIISTFFKYLLLLNDNLWSAGKVDQNGNMGQSSSDHSNLYTDKQAEDESQAVWDQIHLWNRKKKKKKWDNWKHFSWKTVISTTSTITNSNITAPSGAGLVPKKLEEKVSVLIP